MTAEETAAAIISKVGLWWPLAEEDELRRAAGGYERVAAAVRGAASTGSAGAQVLGVNRGPATEAFATHWAQFDGSAEAGLPATAEAATEVARALRAFAGEVEEAKRKIINLAIEIGATIAVGVGMALFTFGTSAGVAAARTAMLVARGFTIAMGLSGVVATIVAGALVGAVFGAVEGFISGIVAQIATTVLSDGDGVSFGETMSWTAWGAGTGLLAGGAGQALRAGVRALRNSDSLLLNRLRSINWADEAGSVRLPPSRAQVAAANERVAARVSNPQTLEGLRRMIPDPIQLERLLGQVPHPPKLSVYTERLGPDELERRIAQIARTGVPQGLTREQLLATSQRLRELTAHLGDDLRIGGSRAAGAASRPLSDMDVTIRVSAQRFDELAAQIAMPAAGSNAERRVVLAIAKGKLDQRLLNIPGLGRASTSLSNLSGLQKVSIAVIREGSKFDHGPWIPVPK